MPSTSVFARRRGGTPRKPVRRSCRPGCRAFAGPPRGRCRGRTRPRKCGAESRRESAANRGISPGTAGGCNRPSEPLRRHTPRSAGRPRGPGRRPCAAACCGGCRRLGFPAHGACGAVRPVPQPAPAKGSSSRTAPRAIGNERCRMPRRCARTRRPSRRPRSRRRGCPRRAAGQRGCRSAPKIYRRSVFSFQTRTHSFFSKS